MASFEIITIPDPVLKQTASPVDRVDDEIRAQMDGMLEAMYTAPGIGLASNQIARLNRIIVMDIDCRDRDSGSRTPICMANPEILWQSEQTSIMQEGCLSLPGAYAEVERPAEVRVKYLDRDGLPQELQASGLLSHCVQHEIDHLNGILFCDYLSSLRKKMLIRRVEKIKKATLF